MSPGESTERYIRSGEYDIDHLQWPGQNIIEKSKNGHHDHLRALVADLSALLTDYRRAVDRLLAPPQLREDDTLF